MEDHKFKEFDGLSLSETVAQLRAQGYAEISTDKTGLILAHPAQSDHVLRLSTHCESCEEFINLCHTHADNPYFPRLGPCHKYDGAAAFVMMTMERLENARHRNDASRSPLVGSARALTLLLEGDEAHATVYEFMLQDQNLRAAVQAIAQSVSRSIIARKTSCLCYESGMDRSLPLEQQETDHILFRPTAHGPELVFAAPFRPVEIHNEKERAALLQHAKLLCARAHLPWEDASSPATSPSLKPPCGLG